MADGVRSRRLKKGLRWQYYGYYKGDKFHSYFKYYNEPDALVARRKHLERLATRGTLTMKLGDVIRMRIDELELKYSRQHAVTTETYLQRAEDKWGFHTPLIDINRDMVQSILNADARRSKAKGCDNYSVNQFRSALHALFEWAIDRYELDGYRNPVSKIKKFPIKSVDRYVPEEWEIEVVERNLRPNQLLLFKFVKETGCRIGEALKVQLKDLNFKTNRVTLRSNKFTGFSETKRLIPIPDMMADVKLPSSPKARIFKSWSVNPTFLRNTIRRINRESVNSPKLAYWQGLDGKPEQITEFPWHSLRHLACSTWLSNNMSYIEVMYRLGHRNLKVTMNYCHSLGFTDFTESDADEDEFDF